MALHFIKSIKSKWRVLTGEDIKILLSVLATKEDIIALKQDVTGLRGAVQTLTVSANRLAKAAEDMHQEFIAISAKVDRHEK